LASGLQFNADSCQPFGIPDVFTFAHDENQPTRFRTMTIRTIAALTAVLLVMHNTGCTEKNCTRPEGAWTNREGQTFVFAPDGNGLWLTRFGTSYDTLRFRYAVDCTTDPNAIDMKDFKTGPYENKTLYGIVEMLTDSSFRLRYEAGADPSVRPVAFDADQTVKLYQTESK
jgi:hypothetical protein